MSRIEKPFEELTKKIEVDAEEERRRLFDEDAAVDEYVANFTQGLSDVLTRDISKQIKATNRALANGDLVEEYGYAVNYYNSNNSWYGSQSTTGGYATAEEAEAAALKHCDEMKAFELKRGEKVSRKTYSVSRALVPPNR